MRIHSRLVQYESVGFFHAHFYISEFDNVVVDLENFVERFKDIGKNLNLLSTYYLYDILEAGE